MIFFSGEFFYNRSLLFLCSSMMKRFCNHQYVPKTSVSHVWRDVKARSIARSLHTTSERHCYVVVWRRFKVHMTSFERHVQVGMSHKKQRVLETIFFLFSLMNHPVQTYCANIFSPFHPNHVCPLFLPVFFFFYEMFVFLNVSIFPSRW